MTRKNPARETHLAPSRHPGMNWTQRKGSGPQKVNVPTSRCPLFSDGKHRIKISPAGVRTACLCGASR